MSVIREEQNDVLPSECELPYVATLIARLRRELPDQVRAIPDPELKRQVEDTCKAAEVLAINKLDHVFRFFRLRYLPVSVWERPGAEEILVRVLTDTSVDADRRLTFVETCIAPSGVKLSSR